MAALVSFIMSFFKKPASISWIHEFGLPRPPVVHQVLDENFISRFSEVFVIGDVHGCYDELVELLRKSSTDNDTVLKLFVGDLVNKGPKNKEVVQLLRTMPETALSVRGNHDEVVLREYMRSKANKGYHLAPRNLWIKELDEADINYLQTLPYTISIPSLNVLLVHAGVVPGIPLERMSPKDMVSMRNLTFGDYFWGKGVVATKSATVGEPWAPVWPGPVHVYFGHDAKRMLQLCPYATGLDTGCVYGKKLTGIFIKGPRKGTIVDVPAKRAWKPIEDD